MRETAVENEQAEQLVRHHRVGVAQAARCDAHRPAGTVGLTDCSRPQRRTDPAARRVGRLAAASDLLFSALDLHALLPVASVPLLTRRIRPALETLRRAEAAEGRLVLAVDISHWLRPDAPTGAGEAADVDAVEADVAHRPGVMPLRPRALGVASHAGVSRSAWPVRRR
jgi:hypothetical protein